MIDHFKQLEFLYGKDASVQIPNSLFRELSDNFKNKNGERNSRHVSFAYSYLVATAFLYKYAHFVDLSTDTYIQNGDMKELLGYCRTGKTIDRVISKNGLLEKMGLVQTVKDYPVYFTMEKTSEKKNRLREFTFIGDLSEDDILYERIRKVVKNRNYEIREPLFLTGIDGEEGTLMDFRNTHKITIQELLIFLGDEKLTNSDFMLYSYFKSKCQRSPSEGKSIAIPKIMADVGMDASTFYDKLNHLKERGFVHVVHGKWRMKNPTHYVRMVANKYFWKGVS